MMNGPPPRLLLTASEAYPALEDLFLTAERRISAGFRIFDPTTKLRSDAALAIGSTWADLIAHTLSRGVRIRIVLSDFDPVIRTELHRMAHRTAQGWRDAADTVDKQDALEVIVSMHAARVGIMPRLLFWPRVYKEAKKTAEEFNAMSDDDARIAIAEAPGLRDIFEGEVGALRARRWPPVSLVPATHHQKLAVFDSETVFIGGLDINNRRYDTPDHEQDAEDTWHDIQIIHQGPIAKEAETHLEAMIDSIENRTAKGSEPPLLRTMSARRRWNLFRMSPHPMLSEISDRTQQAITAAEKFIYLESQFLRDPDLAHTLAAAARERPDLTLLVVLPAAPEEAAFDDAVSSDVRYGEYLQAQAIRRVMRAFGNRAFFMSPAQNRVGTATGRGALGGAPIIYLHAKLSIFDSATTIVSSANLNGRSARWDTEAGALLNDPKFSAAALDRCMRHWLPDDPDAALLDPATAVSAWRALAYRNARVPPEERQGFVMPFPQRATRRFGRNLPGVPAEMV